MELRLLHRAVTGGQSAAVSVRAPGRPRQRNGQRLRGQGRVGRCSRVRGAVHGAPPPRPGTRAPHGARPRHRRADTGCLRPRLAEARLVSRRVRVRHLAAPPRRQRAHRALSHRDRDAPTAPRRRGDLRVPPGAGTLGRSDDGFRSGDREAAGRGASDLRAARRGRLQAPRDRHAPRDLRRHVEGAAPPCRSFCGAISRSSVPPDGAIEVLWTNTSPRGSRSPSTTKISTRGREREIEAHLSTCEVPRGPRGPAGDHRSCARPSLATPHGRRWSRQLERIRSSRIATGARSRRASRPSGRASPRFRRSARRDGSRSHCRSSSPERCSDAAVRWLRLARAARRRTDRLRADLGAGPGVRARRCAGFARAGASARRR